MDAGVAGVAAGGGGDPLTASVAGSEVARAAVRQRASVEERIVMVKQLLAEHEAIGPAACAAACRKELAALKESG